MKWNKLKNDFNCLRSYPDLYLADDVSSRDSISLLLAPLDDRPLSHRRRQRRHFNLKQDSRVNISEVSNKNMTHFILSYIKNLIERTHFCNAWVNEHMKGQYLFLVSNMMIFVSTLFVHGKYLGIIVARSELLKSALSIRHCFPTSISIELNNFINM